MRNGIAPEMNRAEYLARIQCVLDHIELHLGDELDVEGLAKVGCFSPYHFHRVFGAVVGEPLMAFVTRLRLERAAQLLCIDRHRGVSEIGTAVGIPDSTVFARAFRRQFNMSASAWRKAKDAKSKQSKEEGKQSKDFGEPFRHLVSTHERERRQTMTDKLEIAIEVRDASARTLAYVRHIGPYAGDAALFQRLFGKVFTWAGPRGFVRPDTEVLSIYHDNPEITPPERLRISVGLTVPAGTAADGEIGICEIPAGNYAVATCALRPDQYAAAWDELMAGWLPESGWQPDDRPCFEVMKNDPSKDPDGLHRVEIWEPVRPL